MDAVLVPIVFQLEIRCEAKLILARIDKKQCQYLVVAWPNVQTLSLLLHSKYIQQTLQDERYECMSKYTSFPLFRALWSPVGDPALLRFSGPRQGFFALTERRSQARTLAGACLTIMVKLSHD